VFFSLSKLLGESEFYLDENHLPHNTIAQFKAPHSSLDRLQEELRSLNTANIDITLAGLNFVPDLERGLTWVELLVLKSEQLLALQNQVLSMHFAKDFELQNWGVRDAYRPHITIGAVKGYGVPKINLVNYTELLRGHFTAKVVAGKNGEHYTFKG
jgi:2'-5' RNA ligase